MCKCLPSVLLRIGRLLKDGARWPFLPVSIADEHTEELYRYKPEVRK